MSKERKGIPKSAETRKRMSLAQKSKPPMSVETRHKISKKLTGRTHTTEQRIINSLSKLGKPKTIEHANNISKGRKGIKFSKSHKQNIKFARARQAIVQYMLKETLKYFSIID